MQQYRTYCITLLLLVLTTLYGVTQPPQTAVQVLVAPTHADWLYRTGENITFTIRVYQNGNLLQNVPVTYSVGLEKQPPMLTKSEKAANGILEINMPGLESPGFLRCIATVEVNGKTYKGMATAGFSPEKITPTVVEPADFDQFWKKSIEDLAKIPLAPQMTLMPELCTANVNVYHVSLQNQQLGSKIYGIICVPKKEGKYPALLHVPGAGIRPYVGDTDMAEKGIITFQIGVHGIPLNLGSEVYESLATGALYQHYLLNAESKDHFYYKRIILGCIRANDFLAQLPQFDGKNLAVMGGSQGGALAIATASLDNRVRYIGALYPSFCDITGTLHQRAGGSPYFVLNDRKEIAPKAGVIEALAYYDTVLFAKRIKIPGFYTWGFNDESCPPTAIYAAYNGITAPKELYLPVHMGHWYSHEHRDVVSNWLFKQLTK